MSSVAVGQLVTRASNWVKHRSRLASTRMGKSVQIPNLKIMARDTVCLTSLECIW